MAEAKQIPLDELLFGSKPDPTARPVPSLAEVISGCYRNGLSGSLRDQTASAATKGQYSQATNETSGASRNWARVFDSQAPLPNQRNQLSESEI